MIDLGKVKPGSTLRVPFSSYDKDDGSSITCTNYAAADILVYKDGGTTERASTAGYTATTDFDAKTGKHVAIIDLADNTTAGFFAAGSEYIVAIDAVTVDAVTTGGWIARFRIGYEGAMLDTTIATLSSQTSFTLTAGPAEDDALNDQWCIIHDVASAVQCGKAIISDYTGSTKTVTLAAGTTFTAAATDNISIMGPMPMQPATAGRKPVVDATGIVDANLEKIDNDADAAVGVYQIGLLQFNYDHINTEANILSIGISSVTSQTIFVLDGGVATDDYYNGMLGTIQSPNTPDRHYFRVVDYVGSTNTLTIDAAAPFTVNATNHEVNIIATPKQVVALPTATAGAAGGVFIAGTNAATTVTTALTTTFTGSLTGSVASVTGGINTGSGVITTLDGLDTAQDTQHATTQAAIAGIGTAGGAAVNTDATTDNASGGISGVTSGTTKVGTQTGTFANTVAVDGSYHVITHSGNAIDWVYQFLTGGGTSVVGATWTGYLDGANDTITFYAWNHVGGAWESLGTQAGQAGTTNVVKNITLFSRHRGTSAAELGKVYIRLACTGMTSPVLRTDQLYVSYAITSRSVGYALGAVWIDTTNGVAGTESFVNGVADNPVLTLADALTIATANLLRKFEVGNGSTITLASTTSNKVFNGHEWTLALGGQDISSSMFIDASVSGTGTGTAAEFEDCEIGTTTVGPSFFHNCSFGSTFTVGAAGDYYFYNCHSSVAGTGTPTFDLATAGANNLSFRRWSGGMTLNNVSSNDVISIDVVSGGTITINGADGNVQVRGMCNVVDNRTGSPTLGLTNNMDYRFDNLDTAAADIPTVSEFNARTLVAADYATNADLDALTATVGVAGAGLTEAGGTGDQLTALATQASVNTIDGVVDAILALLDDARTEPGQGAPPVNPDLATKIDYLYKAWRNKKTQTSTTFSLFADDTTTVDQKATTSDDGTTTTIGEIATGP